VTWRWNGGPGLVAEPATAALVGADGLVLMECTIGLGFLAPGESGLLIAATTADTVSRFPIL
jgi:membrane-associated protein